MFRRSEVCGAGVEDVVCGAGVEDVVCGAGVEDVVCGAGVEDVVCGAGVEDVVCGAGVEDVVCSAVWRMWCFYLSEVSDEFSSCWVDELSLPHVCELFLQGGRGVL